MKESIAGASEANATEKSNNFQMAKLTAWWNNKPYRRSPERAILAPDRPQQTQFEDADAIAPYDERRITLTLDRFRAYISRLGFTATSASVKIRKLKDLNAFYDPDTKELRIASELTRDKDVLLHAYMQYILSEGGKRFWGELTLGGLADYFVCSFKGDPVIGERLVEVSNKKSKSYNKPYLRNLNNQLRFDKLEDLSSHSDHAIGEVWGGAFWELRENMGRDEKHNHRADVLLLKSWQDFKLPPPNDVAREAFLSQLLEADKELYKGRDTAKILGVFERRGLHPELPADVFAP
jgi:hypothetical protein